MSNLKQKLTKGGATAVIVIAVLEEPETENI